MPKKMSYNSIPDTNISDNSSKDTLTLSGLASGASDFNLSSASPNNQGNHDFKKNNNNNNINNVSKFTSSDTTDGSSKVNVPSMTSESSKNFFKSTSATSADPSVLEHTRNKEIPEAFTLSTTLSQNPSTQSFNTEYPISSSETGYMNSEKKYFCNTCGKAFSRKHNLVSHELIHSQVKPHICSVCSLSFRRIHDLKRHEKLHTGEKPFKCEYCPKSFARPDSLVRHQNSQNACLGLSKSLKLSDNNASNNKSLSVGLSNSSNAIEKESNPTRSIEKSQQDDVPLSKASTSNSMPIHLNPTELPPIRNYSSGEVSSSVSRYPSELPTDVVKQYYPGRGETINQQSNYVDGKHIKTTTIMTTHDNVRGDYNAQDLVDHDRQHNKVINKFNKEQKQKDRDKDIIQNSGSTVDSGGSLELSAAGLSNESDSRMPVGSETAALGYDSSSGPSRPHPTPSLDDPEREAETTGDVTGHAAGAKVSGGGGSKATAAQPTDINPMTGGSNKMNLGYDSPSGSSENEIQRKGNTNIAEEFEGTVPLSAQGRGSFQGDKQFMYNQLRDSSIYQYPNKEYISLSRYQDLVAYTQSLEESLNKINSRIQLLEDESADNRIERERAKQVTDSHKNTRHHKRKRDKDS